MARITWQNVAAPDLSGAANTSIAAGRAFTGAFDNFASVMQNMQKERAMAASNAELQKLAQVGSADQVDQYLKSMNIDPNNMTPQLREQMLALRGTAQGYDGTKLNQQNTQSIIGQRAEDAQYKRDLTQQSAQFNTDQQEAYRLRREGKYSEADQLIEQSLAQNPVAASQANPAVISQTLRSIDSAPDAYQYTTEGRAEKAAEQAVFAVALKETDPVRAKNAAYQHALSLGLNPVQAARLSEKSVQVMGAVPTGSTGGLNDDPNAVAEVLKMAAQPTVTQGQQIGDSPTDIITQATRPSPFESAVPTMPQDASDDEIRSMVEQNPVDAARLADPVISSVTTALSAQGGNDVDRAYDIMSSGEAGESSPKEILKNLYADLSEDDKARSSAQLESAVKVIARDAKVSDSAARAALLATVDPTNWMGFVSEPSPKISAAIEVAKQVNDPAQHNRMSTRRAKLNNYKEDLAAATADIEKNMSTIRTLSTTRNISMSPEDQAKNLRTARDGLAKGLSRVNKLSNDVDRTFNLGFNAERDNSIKGLNTGTQASSNAPTQTVDVDKTLDRIVPNLSNAGMSGTEIEEATPQIKKAITQANREYTTQDKATNKISKIVSNTVEEYKKKSSSAVLGKMTASEIEKAAIRDIPVQRLTQLKAEIRDIPELMKYDYMSTKEFQDALPQLMKDLEKVSAKNTKPTDADIAKTVLDEIKNK